MFEVRGLNIMGFEVSQGGGPPSNGSGAPPTSQGTPASRSPLPTNPITGRQLSNADFGMQLIDEVMDEYEDGGAPARASEPPSQPQPAARPGAEERVEPSPDAAPSGARAPSEDQTRNPHASRANDVPAAPADPQLKAALSSMGLDDEAPSDDPSTVSDQSSSVPLEWGYDDTGQRARTLYEQTSEDNRGSLTHVYRNYAASQAQIQKLERELSEVTEEIHSYASEPFNEEASLRRHEEALREERPDLEGEELELEVQRRMAHDKLRYDKRASAMRERIAERRSKYREKTEASGREAQEQERRRAAECVEAAGENELLADYMAAIGVGELREAPIAEVAKAAEARVEDRIATALTRVGDKRGVVAAAIEKVVQKDPGLMKKLVAFYHAKASRATPSQAADHRGPQLVPTEPHGSRARAARPGDGQGYGDLSLKEHSDNLLSDVLRSTENGGRPSRLPA